VAVYNSWRRGGRREWGEWGAGQAATAGPSGGMFAGFVELEVGWAGLESRMDDLVEQVWDPKMRNQTWGPDVGVVIGNQEYMAHFTQVYNMCTQKPPNNHNTALYVRYTGWLDKLSAERLLPALDVPDAELHEVLSRVAPLHYGGPVDEKVFLVPRPLPHQAPQPAEHRRGGF
jgi:hypothetical protein